MRPLNGPAGLGQSAAGPQPLCDQRSDPFALVLLKVVTSVGDHVQLPGARNQLLDEPPDGLSGSAGSESAHKTRVGRLSPESASITA